MFSPLTQNYTPNRNVDPKPNILPPTQHFANQKFCSWHKNSTTEPKFYSKFKIFILAQNVYTLTLYSSSNPPTSIEVPSTIPLGYSSWGPVWEGLGPSLGMWKFRTFRGSSEVNVDTKGSHLRWMWTFRRVIWGQCGRSGGSSEVNVDTKLGHLHLKGVIWGEYAHSGVSSVVNVDIQAGHLRWNRTLRGVIRGEWGHSGGSSQVNVDIQGVLWGEWGH